MKYYVYVLTSLFDERSYVGFTNNLERRLREHNNGKNYYTKRYRPWKVLYSEEFDSLIMAVKREKYLKSSSGRKLVLKALFKN